MSSISIFSVRFSPILIYFQTFHFFPNIGTPSGSDFCPLPIFKKFGNISRFSGFPVPPPEKEDVLENVVR